MSQVIPLSLSSLFEKGDPLTPRMNWDKGKLQRQWNIWDQAAKDVYLAWLEKAKEHEAENSLDHARYAAHKALQFRFWRAMGMEKGWEYE